MEHRLVMQDMLDAVKSDVCSAVIRNNHDTQLKLIRYTDNKTNMGCNFVINCTYYPYLGIDDSISKSIDIELYVQGMRNA